MKVVTHVVCLCDSVIAIVYSKEGDLLFFEGSFGEIGDDTDSIFIVGEDGAWVTVGRVCFDDAIGFGWDFSFIDGDVSACILLFFDFFDVLFEGVWLVLCFLEVFVFDGVFFAFTNIESRLRSCDVFVDERRASFFVILIVVYFWQWDDGFGDDGWASECG